MNRDQLHLCDEVSAALHGRHKGTRPGRRIFDERSGIGNTGFIGVTDGMCNAGIRYACDDIGMNRAGISFCEGSAAVITHALHADTFVGGRGISIINPEECADFHLFAWSDQRADPFGSHDDNFSGTELPQWLIAEV